MVSQMENDAASLSEGCSHAMHFYGCRIRHLEGMQRRSGGRGRSRSPASASARHSTHVSDSLPHDLPGPASAVGPQTGRRAHSGSLPPEGSLAPVTETAEQESSSSPGGASRECSSSHSSMQDNPLRAASPTPSTDSPACIPPDTPAGSLPCTTPDLSSGGTTRQQDERSTQRLGSAAFISNNPAPSGPEMQDRHGSLELNTASNRPVTGTSTDSSAESAGSGRVLPADKAMQAPSSQSSLATQCQ